jgi:Meckel syndrome type 1 protein
MMCSAANAAHPCASEPVIMFCARCQSPLAEGAKFCKACGEIVAVTDAPASAQRCPHCQMPLPLGAKFCKHCGAHLTAPEPEAAPAQERLVGEMSVSPMPSPASSAAPFSVIQDVSALTKPGGGSGKKLLWGACLLLAALGVAIALYVVLSGKAATPDAPDAPPPASAVAEPAPTPDAAAEPASIAPTPPSAPTPTVAPAAAPSSAATPPRAPRTVARPAPAESEEEQPPPKPKTCDGLSGFSILLCRTEGARRFWHCAPDGVNWNNDIPGCQRDAGNRSRPY